MAGANAGAIVAVKVFVKGNQIEPGRIGLEFCSGAENRPLLVHVFQADARESSGNLAGNFAQRQHLPGTNRTFNSEIIAEIMMKLLQRLDQQKIQRKPDWSTPV